ncbi:MAG: zinc transporter ZupT [Patescibacteria group bacterium]|nr:zinc transporter ZupT [Patescibacteria group bacterium]
MIEFSNFWIAVLLTSFAGLSTGIGGLLAFFTKKTNTKVLSISLGFSAGVMIYISFVELLAHAQETLFLNLGNIGLWICITSFFVGFGIIALIDRLVPSYENPHEMHKIEELDDKEKAKKFKKLYRVGLLMALAISIHNFPEGLVTFLSTMTSLELGLAIAFAIAIHNIPEGIAVSIPIFYATGSRKKAFFYSFLSGLAEPVGGILGYLILRPFINDVVIGIVFALIAGIMVFISFDSLLPSAEKYGKHHLSIFGLVIGMIIMAVSLLLF